MKALLKRLSQAAGLRALLGAAVLFAGTLTAAEPTSDMRAVSKMVMPTLVPSTQDLTGLPRMPNMLDLVDLVAQNPDVVAEASKLGLKATDKVADTLDAIQDSTLFKIFNSTGVEGVKQLGDFLEKALERGEKLTEFLSKNQDKIKGASKKLKILDYVLKGIKLAHLSGHVIEAAWNQDRAKFSDAVNELTKGTLKMGAGIGGGMGGGALGVTIGTAIGSLFGGVGAVPGAVIGGVIGSWLGSEGAERLTEWGYDSWIKDWVKNGATGVFDWVFGPPQQAPPLLPPPLPPGGSGTGGSSGGGRSAPKLNKFR